MRYLMTADLLNDWMAYVNSDGESKPYADFHNRLNRFSFNSSVYKRQFFNYMAGDDLLKNVPGLQEIKETCGGGTLNCKGSGNLRVNEKEYKPYCKVDVIRGPVIFEICYDERYQVGRFFNDNRHKIAFACFNKMTDFVYLICDGKEVFEEHYHRDEVEPVNNVILDFQQWLAINSGARNIYKEKWAVKNG